MTEQEIINIATEYLIKDRVVFVEPGKLGEFEGDSVEVIFLKPEALNPNIIIDPPDVRVLVNTKTREVSWVHQM